jgi:ferredoxin
MHVEKRKRKQAKEGVGKESQDHFNSVVARCCVWCGVCVYVCTPCGERKREKVRRQHPRKKKQEREQCAIPFSPSLDLLSSFLFSWQ